MTLTSDDSSLTMKTNQSNDTASVNDYVVKNIIPLSVGEMFTYESVRHKTFYYGKLFIELLGIYFFWIVVHYVCAHMYAYWCAPFSFIGFILSPFFVPAPHCQAFRWVIVNSSNSIITMWITLGSWCVKKIIV
jgi:hypothetical protein